MIRATSAEPDRTDEASALHRVLLQQKLRLSDLTLDPALPPSSYWRIVETRDVIGAHLLASEALQEAGSHARAHDVLVRACALVFERTFAAS